MATVVNLRNPKRKRGTTKKRRNSAVKSTAANPRRKSSTRRRRRSNPSTAPRTTAANPRRKGTRRRRRNGATRRNGIFSDARGMLSTLAFGASGAIATGIVGRGVMSAIGGRADGLPVPAYVVQGAVEGLTAIVPVRMISDKLFSRDNADKIVAGGLIKAGLTVAGGFLPAVTEFNPLGGSRRLITNEAGELSDDITSTDVLAGAYYDDETDDELSGYENYAGEDF